MRYTCRGNMDSITSLGSQPPESHMAVAELLVSLSHSSRNKNNLGQGGRGLGGQTNTLPAYHDAVEYIGSVKKAYERTPRVYTEFLDVLEKYHGRSLTIDQLVQSVVALFQHQPDLLLRFKEFLPEVREVMDDLVPPESFSEQCEESARRKTLKARPQATLLATISAASSPDQGGVEVPTISTSNDDDENVAANFLNLIKDRSQREPNMYQHMIALLRSFQKNRSYIELYPSISIVLRHHLSLLQQFQTFLPTAPSDSELKEARAISESPPDELLVSPEFVEARRFIQAVKHESKCEMSMYDRFIQALEKYQNMGWNIDQIYAEVSLIFWNNPDLVDGFKKFISILQ